MSLVQAASESDFRQAVAVRQKAREGEYLKAGEGPAIHTSSLHSTIVVANDDDLQITLHGKEMADWFGNLLATKYPGYRWRIEPHPHPTHPFVDIRCEAGAGALGFTVCPKNHFSYTELKHYTIMQAGEHLERLELNRRRMDEVEFIGRAKTFAGLFLPHLDGVKI